ncbi:hypothetical protein ABIB00_003900 [Bradyrhizobium sp. LB14.3]|uniref:hypothetical protein n=1 Tax=Bradyrhizobium sp. LB14.3 TaxID=3156328 RepID=UPI0033960245
MFDAVVLICPATTSILSIAKPSSISGGQLLEDNAMAIQVRTGWRKSFLTPDLNSGAAAIRCGSPTLMVSTST